MVYLRGRRRTCTKRARFNQDVLGEEVAVAELDVVVAESRVVELRSFLQHDDLIPGLSQHRRSDAAARARTDDEDFALGEGHPQALLNGPVICCQVQPCPGAGPPALMNDGPLKLSMSQ